MRSLRFPGALRWLPLVALAALLVAGCRSCGGGTGTFVPECGPEAGMCPAGFTCEFGLCRCSPSPEGEVCDGTDNDCDREVDEVGDGGLIDIGAKCPGAEGACAEGETVCVDGELGCSVEPIPEKCNKIDDDCDGTVDNGAMPVPEVCNNLDDDCDGVIDNGVPACACAPGGPGPGPEVCNEIDDDCNEMIDEINTLNGMPCGQFGDPCTMNSDCSSQLCVGDVYEMYCSDECTMIGDPGDCPTGYRCWDNPNMGEDDYCRRNYAPCARAADCAPGEICAIVCNDTGDAVATECRPAIAGGAAAPAACTGDTDCETYDCFRTGICTEVCASDADCAAGHRCVMLRTQLCGPTEYVPRCLDMCDCDSECPAGQMCQPWVHVVLPPDTPTAEGACDTPYPGGAPGDPCDLTSMPTMSCEHSICSNNGTGFCTQVCSATCGCPAPIGPCIATSVTFPVLGSYPAMTCQTM